MTRESNGTTADKTACFDAKPATVELDDGRTIDATHHIKTDDGVLHLYLGDRSNCIDVTVPLTSVRAWARSDDGAEALGIVEGVETGPDGELPASGGKGPEDSRKYDRDDGTGDSEHEIVTDGGRDMDDLVWVDDGRFRLSKKFVQTRCGSDAARVEKSDGDCAYWSPECDEVTTLRLGGIEFVRVDDDTDEDDDDEPRLVTDGGIDFSVTPAAAAAAEHARMCAAMESARECDVDGCDRQKSDSRETYCDECLEDAHGEDDDVTPCENPACDGLAQPGTDTCNSRCAKTVALAREFLDGAGWDDLQLGGYTLKWVKEALDAHRDASGGEL